MFPTNYPSDDPLLLFFELLVPRSWPMPLPVIWLFSPIWAPVAQWVLQSRNRRWSIALAVLALYFPGFTFAITVFDFDFDYSPLDSWLNFWVRATGFAGGVFVVFWFFTAIGLALWMANIIVAWRKGRERSPRPTRRLLVWSALLFLATSAPTYYLATYKTLEDAVKEGNVVLAQKRLHYNLLGVNANTGQIVQISSTPPLARPLLPIAIRNDDIEMVRLLLDNGARVETTIDAWARDNPMQTACSQSTYDIVKILLDYGGDPNEGLHAAAAANRVDVLQLLIDRGADVHTLDNEGKTVLDAAAHAKAEDAIKFLSPYGLEVTDYWSLLRSNQLEWFKTALESGLLCERWRAGSDAFRQELLLDAARNNSPKILEYLLAEGIKPTLLEDGGTLLHAAARCGAVGAAKILVEHGMNPNELNDSGSTPLCPATFNWQPEIIAFLLDEGADPNLGNGRKPLTLAVERLNADAARLLLEHGAKLEGDSKASPLLRVLVDSPSLNRVVVKRTLATARVLVTYGADPATAVGEDGMNAIECANDRGYSDLAAYLRAHARPAD